MKKRVIRLTESDIHRMVIEGVNQVLSEMDGGMGGGALGAGNVNVGNSDVAGGITTPFGSIQRRKLGTGRNGDITKQDSNVDMTPAMDRRPGKMMMNRKK